MSKAILYSLLSFLFFSTTLFAQSEEEKLLDSLNIPYDSNEVNMLTFKKSFSPHRESWSINYSWFADTDDDFIVPMGFSYGRDQIKGHVLENLGYKSAETFALGFGADGYLKLDKGLYLGIGATVSPGMETIVKTNHHKSDYFFLGAQFKQGVRFMPWRKLGIVVGADFFQKLQHSKVYTTELGWTFEVGINF